MYCIGINVYCSLYERKDTVYYYLDEKGISFNGCENWHGSQHCLECGKQNYSKAFEEKNFCVYI